MKDSCSDFVAFEDAADNAQSAWCEISKWLEQTFL